MSDRPILFSAEMVRAILDGRKTQTRRMVKPQPPAETESVSRQLSSREAPELDGAWTCLAGKPQKPITKPLFCPYGDTGDLLWVRETWAGHASGIDYAADFAAICLPQAGPWRPSIHMPRWASRITLRITDIRVERLQDISEDDALAEGVTPLDYAAHHVAAGCGARIAFEQLWNKINSPGAWETNPWVWVMSFERVKP